MKTTFPDLHMLAEQLYPAIQHLDPPRRVEVETPEGPKPAPEEYFSAVAKDMFRHGMLHAVRESPDGLADMKYLVAFFAQKPADVLRQLAMQIDSCAKFPDLARKDYADRGIGLDVRDMIFPQGIEESCRDAYRLDQAVQICRNMAAALQLLNELCRRHLANPGLDER